MSEDNDVVRRAEQRIGTVLRGKYRIDRVLGIGGMAVVYAATHRNKKRFAVKMLHPELSIRDDIRTRFLREGYVANSVEHPGAVAVLDDDVAEDGAAFLVMELLDGAGVEQLWEQSGSRLPARVVLALSYQLLDVLAAAHARSIVHRDIKPANVFLTREGRLKVLDFGIARLRDATSGHATNTGMLLGTPAFMAPEQALGQSNLIDGLTDVWAVGATMFSLLSGAIVHVGENPQQLMVAAATRPARSLATVAPASPRVVALVDRALAFDKAHRWASAAHMRDAVREAYLAEFSTNLSDAPLLALFAPGADHSATVQADTVSSGQFDPPQVGSRPPSIREGTPSPAVSMPRPPPEGAPVTYTGASHTVGGPKAGGRPWAWIVAAGIGASALAAGGVFVAMRAGGHAASVSSQGAKAPGESVELPAQATTRQAPVASAQAAAADTSPAPVRAAAEATPAPRAAVADPVQSAPQSAPPRKRSTPAPSSSPVVSQAASPSARAPAQAPAPSPAPAAHGNPLNMGLQ